MDTFIPVLSFSLLSLFLFIPSLLSHNSVQLLNCVTLHRPLSVAIYRQSCTFCLHSSLSFDCFESVYFSTLFANSSVAVIKKRIMYRNAFNLSLSPRDTFIHLFVFPYHHMLRGDVDITVRVEVREKRGRGIPIHDSLAFIIITIRKCRRSVSASLHFPLSTVSLLSTSLLAFSIV